MRATRSQPQARRARWAAPAEAGTLRVARSSGRPRSRMECSSAPMPWRRQAARTMSAVTAKVRPGCSSVIAAGSGVVTSFHHEVDGRSGMPAAYPTR